MKFVHKSGQIVDLPAHFANAKVARNFTPLEDEVEEDKVILSHTPNSQLRVGKKVKEKEPIVDFDSNEDVD